MLNKTDIKHYHISVGVPGITWQNVDLKDGTESVGYFMGMLKSLGAQQAYPPEDLLEIEKSIYDLLEGKIDAGGFIINVKPFMLLWLPCAGCVDSSRN